MPKGESLSESGPRTKKIGFVSGITRRLHFPGTKIKDSSAHGDTGMFSRTSSAPTAERDDSSVDLSPDKHHKQGKVKKAISWFVSLTQSGLRKDYEILNSELGKGKYGVVRPVINRKTSEMSAVKILPKVGPDGKDEIKFAMREIDIMRRVNHPNCIRMYGTYESSKHIYIVMELVEGGQLLERIVHQDHYSETEAAKVFVQMVSAIDYLHAQGVVHRDLKPENILYKTKAADSPIKVCDFGLGRAIDLDQLGRSRFWSRCGSPDYVAPEVLMRHGYGMECDVWSVGVILYIMLCGCPPFGSKSVTVKFEMITKGEYSFPQSHWKDISEDAKDMVRKMLTVNPKQRSTCREALCHPWLARLQRNDLPTSKMPNMQHRLLVWNAERKLLAAVTTVAALRRLTGGNMNVELPSEAEAGEFMKALKEDSEKMDELTQAYKLLDRDGNGMVRLETLARLEQICGIRKNPIHLEEAFHHFDVDDKGFIDFEDFCIMMACCGQSEEERFSRASSAASAASAASSEDGAKRIDRNRNRGLLGKSLDQDLLQKMQQGEDISEHLKFNASPEHSVILTNDDIVAAFKALDISSKGSVTAQELKLVLERFGSDVTMSEAKEIIAVVDTGKTGKLGTYKSRLTHSFVTLDGIRINCARHRLNYARELTRKRRTIRVGRPAQLDTIALKWPRRHQLSDAPRLGWPKVMKRSVECGARCAVCAC